MPFKTRKVYLSLDDLDTKIMPKTILVIVPHPDDAEFYAGGTLAGFARSGDRLIIVTTTDGSKGSYELDGMSLISARKQEANNAAADWVPRRSF